jgi:hypothetical protein
MDKERNRLEKQVAEAAEELRVLEEAAEIGPVYGPRRKAPMFYAGETYGRRKMLYPDVERHSNGATSSTRNKAARRLIRKAFKQHHSRVEKGIKLVRAMKAQAVEVIGDEHYDRSKTAQARMARRLLAQELAIHQPAYVPENLRALRTARRKLKRHGKQDAISQLVERMAGERK